MKWTLINTHTHTHTHTQAFEWTEDVLIISVICSKVMHVFFIYDESVCKTTDPCAEFKEQMNVLRKFTSYAEFNFFTHLASIASSGSYARYVIRKYQLVSTIIRK